MLLSGSAEASTSISDTNTCKINIRKFVSPGNLQVTIISNPGFPDEAKKASMMIARLRSSIS
jgi:hypothetical protein